MLFNNRTAVWLIVSRVGSIVYRLAKIRHWRTICSDWQRHVIEGQSYSDWQSCVVGQTCADSHIYVIEGQLFTCTDGQLRYSSLRFNRVQIDKIRHWGLIVYRSLVKLRHLGPIVCGPTRSIHCWDVIVYRSASYVIQGISPSQTLQLS